MGPYCRYCDRRCFVERILHDDQWSLLATCEAGMEHDRERVGEDHVTARNPRNPDSMAGRRRSPAWIRYYRNHPEVSATWGEQNGREPTCTCAACSPVNAGPTG
jgi:hypothetical protein